MGHGLALERGFFPAVPVPLWADGSLDEASQKRYVSYMHSQAPTGVAVWAHTGRGLALSRSQREYVLKSWRDGLPEGLIIAGAGGSTDDEAMRMAEDAAAWGADCIMAYPPQRHRASEEAVVRYHRRLAAAGKPLVLFFLYEAAGGVTYSLPVLRELLQIPAVAGIKMATLDSVMTFQDVAGLVRSEAPGQVLITGEDRFLGYSLMCGAQSGLVGMGAACTRMQHDLLRCWQAGDSHGFLSRPRRLPLRQGGA